MQFDWTVSNKKYSSVLSETSDLEVEGGNCVYRVLVNVATFHLWKEH